MHMRMYVNKILILRMMGLHLISLSDTRSSSSSSSIRRLRIRVVVVAAIIFFFYFVDCRCLGNTFWRLCWHVVASMMNEVHDGVFIKKNIYTYLVHGMAVAWQPWRNATASQQGCCWTTAIRGHTCTNALTKACGGCWILLYARFVTFAIYWDDECECEENMRAFWA